MKRAMAMVLGFVLACLALAPGQAFAAPGIETRIVDLAGSGLQQSSPQPWISGKLRTAAGDPVAAAQVRIEHPLGEPESAQATGTTGADGSFDIGDFTGPAPWPPTTEPYAFDGRYRAHFAGTEEYAASSAEVILESDKRATRLTLDTPAAGPYAVGSTLTVSGTLELEQEDGTWARPASAQVGVITSAYGDGTNSGSAQVVDGRFTYDLTILNEVDEGAGADGGPFLGAIYDGGSDNDYQRVIWGPLRPVVSDRVTVEVSPPVLGKNATIRVHAESPDGTPLAGQIGRAHV